MGIWESRSDQRPNQRTLKWLKTFANKTKKFIIILILLNLIIIVMQEDYEKLKKYWLEDNEALLFSIFFSSEKFKKDILWVIKQYIIMFLLYIVFVWFIFLLISFKFNFDKEILPILLSLYLICFLIGFYLIDYFITDAVMFNKLKIDFKIFSKIFWIDDLYKDFFEILTVWYKDMDLNLFSSFDEIALKILSLYSFSCRTNGFQNIKIDVSTLFNRFFASSKIQNKIIWNWSKIMSFWCGKWWKSTCMWWWYINMISFDVPNGFQKKIEVLQEKSWPKSFVLMDVFKILVFSLFLTFILVWLLNTIIHTNVVFNIFIYIVIFTIWVIVEIKLKNRNLVKVKNIRLEKGYSIYCDDSDYVKTMEVLWLFDILEKFVFDYNYPIDFIFKDKKLYIKTKFIRFSLLSPQKSLINIYKNMKIMRKFILDINLLLQKL